MALIDQKKAIEIALDFAEHEGWTVDDPETAKQMGWSVIDPVLVQADIKDGIPVFTVKTNVNLLDGSTHIVINRHTGAILSVFTPSP